MSDKAIEIVFSFDTTGSMYPCIGQVRKNLENIVTSLFKEVPNLKIGIVAHGDYCDVGRTYLMRSHNLTSNIFEIVNFVRNVGATGGGDAPEAYEYVLNRVRTDFNWSLNSKKILVMIGDATPHDVSYSLNKERLDWRREASLLKDANIDVYSVQCLNRRNSTFFWEELATIGGGYHLELDQFVDIGFLMNAVVYKQVSDEKMQQYEEKLVTSGKMSRSLDKTFGVLSGRPRDAKGRFVAYKHVSSDGSSLTPVSPGRFQILDVEKDSIIRDFVSENSLIFEPGKGFYEFTKRETIQDKKEIVIRDRKTGDMFSGEEARDLLGIPRGMGKGKVSPKHGDKYDVFVQSTSYNRKLIGGTKFLYEVDMRS